MKELNVVVERAQGYMDTHLGTAMKDMERKHYDDAFHIQSHVLHLLRLMRNEGQQVNVKYVNMPELELLQEFSRYKEVNTVETMDSVDIHVHIDKQFTSKNMGLNDIILYIDEDIETSGMRSISHVGVDVWKHFGLNNASYVYMTMLANKVFNNTSFMDDISVENIHRQDAKDPFSVYEQ